MPSRSAIALVDRLHIGRPAIHVAAVAGAETVIARRGRTAGSRGGGCASISAISASHCVGVEEVGMVIDLRRVDHGAAGRRGLASSRAATSAPMRARSLGRAAGGEIFLAAIAWRGFCRALAQKGKGPGRLRRAPALDATILTRRCRRPCRPLRRCGYRPAARRCNSAPSDTGRTPRAGDSRTDRRSSSSG